MKKASTVILINTVSLYLKLIITTIISFVLTRIVLEYLGVNDFGLYNLIAGVIGILAFLNSALMSSSQRYLSVAMGEGSMEHLKNVYSSSMAIHTIFAICMLLIFELLIFFIFDGLLTIEIDRIHAAKIVYQLMVLSTVSTIITVPYSAAINAHEDLWFFAIIETVTKVFQIFVVFVFANTTYDALIVYTIWITIAQLINVLAKVIWCLVKYEETRHFFWRYSTKESIKSMLGFTGWNTLGSIAMVGRNQGIAVVLNVFFGTAVNAVYGIANQLNGQLVYFSQMMTTSMAPQIMKSYGQGDTDRMLRLSVLTSKMAFYLSAIIAIPFLVELQIVLDIWLKDVPNHTATYCSLLLFVFLLLQLYPGITRALYAQGEIKNYQILTSVLLLLPIPVGAIIFKLGCEHFYICYAMIIAQALTLICTIIIANKKVNLNVRGFVKYIVESLCSLFIVLLICYYTKYELDKVLNRYCVLFIVTFVSTISFTSLYYCWVLDKQEKETITSALKRIIKK